jgi:hypothetical protein
VPAARASPRSSLICRARGCSRRCCSCCQRDVRNGFEQMRPERVLIGLPSRRGWKRAAPGNCPSRTIRCGVALLRVARSDRPFATEIIEIARRVPAPVDRCDAVVWLRIHLADPRPGVATIVYHSVVMPYLTEGNRENLR